MLKKGNDYLTYIFVLALVIRLVGITHGFPLILHPDEPAVVRAALGIRFDLNPHHFDWPHLFIYLNYFLYMGFAYFRDVLTNLGLKEPVSSALPLIWNDNLVFYLLSRIFSAVLGALTVIPLYLSAKSLFNKKVAVVAGLALALLPFHVRSSHYALIDVPMLFFFSWSVYFSSQLIYKNKLDNYLLAGFFVGTAASTKYNGVLVSILVPFAHLLRTLYNKEKFKLMSTISSLSLAGLMAVFGFVLGTPFAVIDYDTFVRTDGPSGALWQFTNVGKVNSSEQFKQVIDAVSHKLPDDFGYTILFGFFIVVIALMYKLLGRKTSSDDWKLWFLSLPALLFIYYVSGFEKNRSHYYMISYPFIVLVFGYGLAFIYDRLKVISKIFAVAIALILLSLPMYFSYLNIMDLISTGTSSQVVETE